MNKKRLKIAIARLVGSYRARYQADLMRSRVVILCYHSVHPTKDFASASPEAFDGHLAWLAAHCDVIRFDEALDVARDAATRIRPAVALTFDDGYADNYDYAFPLLRKHGLTATFFVTAGLVDRDPAIVDRLQALRGTAYADICPLTWDQVREMRCGGMDIGSHTYSHPNLAKLADEQVRIELRRSKAIIEANLSEPVSALAYPFGMLRRHVNKDTIRIAEEVGYRRAAAVGFRPVRERDPALALPRFFVTRDDLETLAAKVYGSWDFVGLWYERAPLRLLNLVSPQGAQAS